MTVYVKLNLPIRYVDFTYAEGHIYPVIDIYSNQYGDRIFTIADGEGYCYDFDAGDFVIAIPATKKGE